MKPIIKASLAAAIIFSGLLIKPHLSQAQKVEFSAGANYGLFNYIGSATGSRTYYIGSYNKASITNSMYGRNLTSSYGINLQAQFVSKSNVLLGLQAGYDILRNSIKIGDYDGPIFATTTANTAGAPYMPDIIYNQFSNNGHATTNTQFVNINPYLGYRFKGKTTSVDVTGGAEAGIPTHTEQTVHSKAPDVFTQTINPPLPPTDWRLKAGIALNFKYFTVSTSYAHGVTNYIKSDNNSASNKPTAYSQLLRLGISYKLPI